MVVCCGGYGGREVVRIPRTPRRRGEERRGRCRGRWIGLPIDPAFWRAGNRRVTLPLTGSPGEVWPGRVVPWATLCLTGWCQGGYRGC